MKAHPLLFLLVAGPLFLQAQHGTLPHPAVWLRGDITSPLHWEDQSGNGRDAVTLTGMALEKGKDLNFNPTFAFHELQEAWSVPYGLDHLSGMTIMIVVQAADSLEYGLWGVEKSLSRNLQCTTHRVTGPDSTVHHYPGEGPLPSISTVVQHWSEEPVISESACLILGRIRKDVEMEPFNGQIAEYMVFDHALDFMQRTQVETYLSIKYGIPLGKGNYVSSAGEVLWDSEKLKAYGYRIAGIGRDDAFSLLQKQAASMHDTLSFLTLGVDKIAPSNKENSAVVLPGDFLLWGDNGRPYTIRQENDQDSVLALVERQWLMKATGTTAGGLSTELRVDLSVLPPDSLGYWLVVDRGGAGNFSVNNLEYFVADSTTSDSVAFFRDIHWDSDLSGEDVFGFTQAQDFFTAVNTLRSPTCDNRNSGEVLVHVVSGEGPFQFELTHHGGDLHRQWTGGHKKIQQALEPGRYTLKVTDAKGNIQSREFLLVMPDGPKVDLGKDLELLEETEIVLDASTYIPDTLKVAYDWKNGYDPIGVSPAITVTGSGIYEVTVTRRDNGCAFSDQVIVSDASVRTFDVLPTIASSGAPFTITISLAEPMDIDVSIYDLGGTVSGIMQGEGQAEYRFKTRLDQAGTYLVVLHTPEGTEARKVVVY